MARGPLTKTGRAGRDHPTPPADHRSPNRRRRRRRAALPGRRLRPHQAAGRPDREHLGDRLDCDSSRPLDHGIGRSRRSGSDNRRHPINEPDGGDDGHHGAGNVEDHRAHHRLVKVDDIRVTVTVADDGSPSLTAQVTFPGDIKLRLIGQPDAVRPEAGPTNRPAGSWIRTRSGLQIHGLPSVAHQGDGRPGRRTAAKPR